MMRESSQLLHFRRGLSEPSDDASDVKRGKTDFGSPRDLQPAGLDVVDKTILRAVRQLKAITGTAAKSRKLGNGCPMS